MLSFLKSKPENTLEVKLDLIVEYLKELQLPICVQYESSSVDFTYKGRLFYRIRLDEKIANKYPSMINVHYSVKDDVLKQLSLIQKVESIVKFFVDNFDDVVYEEEHTFSYNGIMINRAGIYLHEGNSKWEIVGFLDFKMWDCYDINQLEVLMNGRVEAKLAKIMNNNTI